MATTPNTNVSVVDYLNSTGKASDYNTRAKLATEYGITGYKGTADQNLQLLGKLKGGSTTPTPTAVVPVPNGQVTNPNQYINQNQNQDFATASKVNDVPVRRSASDIAKEVTSVLGSNLPDKIDTVSFTDKYKQLRADSGLVELESSLNSLQAQARDIEAQKQARINSEKGKPVAMNVISGRVSEVEQQENERLTVINNSIQTATAQLKTKLDAVDTIMKYTAMDYDNAVQNYDKQFSQNVQVMNLVKGIMDDEKSDEERVVDNARANAQIMINTMNANGTTYKNLTPDQQVNLTKLGVQSGLGANFFSDVMNVSAGKEILTTITNDDKTKTTIMYKDGTTKVIPTGLPAGSGVQPKSTGTGGGKLYTSGTLSTPKSNIDKLKNELDKTRGADGYVNSAEYHNSYIDWINNGGLAQDFVKELPPKSYVNPANKDLPVFLQTGTSKSTGSSGSRDLLVN